MKTKKLSKPQQELLDAINGGVVVYFMRDPCCSYYFRSDGHRKCTSTASALYERGLVRRVNDGVFGDHHLVRKESA